MKILLNKELRLATPLLTYIFLSFTLMTFIPGYPILCGAFFVCFGIFQAYQYARESNDMEYSLLLPVSKKDIVKAKYITAVLIQFVAFILFAVFAAIRMTLLKDISVYVNNVMMSANLVFLGFVLLIFAIFNLLFIGGFFKTAYYIGKPFISFSVVGFAVIAFGEALHHFPNMVWINDVRGDSQSLHVLILFFAFTLYVVSTYISYKKSEKKFLMLDI